MQQCGMAKLLKAQPGCAFPFGDSLKLLSDYLARQQH